MTAKASPNLFGDAPLSNEQILGQVHENSDKVKPKSSKTSSLARNLMNQTLAQLAVDDQDEELAQEVKQRKNNQSLQKP